MNSNITKKFPAATGSLHVIIQDASFRDFMVADTNVLEEPATCPSGFISSHPYHRSGCLPSSQPAYINTGDWGIGWVVVVVVVVVGHIR
jgi:hypothetical protein